MNPLENKYKDGNELEEIIRVHLEKINTIEQIWSKDNWSEADKDLILKFKTSLEKAIASFMRDKGLKKREILFYKMMAPAEAKAAISMKIRLTIDMKKARDIQLFYLDKFSVRVSQILRINPEWKNINTIMKSQEGNILDVDMRDVGEYVYMLKYKLEGIEKIHTGDFTMSTVINNGSVLTIPYISN
ncbi:hypothetical protein [Candidatus Magnetomonas plexicatena]|uniref:hypothetical protein n=1 Tax=Candidatus Magnetomonas plexicatena TaxID=2552947 RepID=UPI001C740186|nr:hypothetical protein E2O03_005450 [Nitrospirales bacterium LBB_01]